MMNTIPKQKCSKLGCTEDAYKFPVIAFRAQGLNTGPMASVTMDLPLCDEHAIPDPELYITEEGWDMLVAGMKAKGYAQPEKSSIKISFADVRVEKRN